MSRPDDHNGMPRPDGSDSMPSSPSGGPLPSIGTVHQLIQALQTNKVAATASDDSLGKRNDTSSGNNGSEENPIVKESTFGGSVASTELNPHSNIDLETQSAATENTNGNASHSHSQSPTQPNADDPPRKRSKVSRACDSCRRKKIKCNAEYLTLLQKVTKICQNCVKNNENCTFLRVPLKRGPSKGYIRDLEDKVTDKTMKESYYQIPVPQPLPFPKGPIILPPLVGYNGNQPLPGQSIQNLQTYKPPVPASGTVGGLLTPSVELPPIQGPFWKVPYEMPGYPGLHSHRLLIGHGPAGRRRSSVDLVLSTSTNGLRFLYRSNASGTESDSDDDFYLVRNSLRSLMVLLSPSNLILSLLSLTGRMNRTTIESPPGAQALPYQNYGMYSQPGTTHLPSIDQTAPKVTKLALDASVRDGKKIMEPDGKRNSTLEGVTPNSILNGIKRQEFAPNREEIAQHNIPNLAHYYEHNHPSMPILPYNPHHIPQLLEHEPCDPAIVDAFTAALHHLAHFRTLGAGDASRALAHVLSLYPFRSFGIRVHDLVLVLYFSALVLLNYAVLLSGDTYLVGIGATAMIFNDFRVLENFSLVVQKGAPGVENLDAIHFYLPKLYHCLMIIDLLYALSFGVQRCISDGAPDSFVSLLTRYSGLYIPKNDSPGAVFLNLAPVLLQLVQTRDSIVARGPRTQLPVVPTPSISGLFCSHFQTLVSEKLVFYSFLAEVSALLLDGDTDEVFENLMDHNVKLIRILKKLLSTIMHFANYISTEVGAQRVTLNPLVNIAFGQLFRLIKLNKVVVDALTELILAQKHLDHLAELHSRCVKVNSDLLISFNLLNLNVANMPLGKAAASAIRNRIAEYNLTFGLKSGGPTGVRESFLVWSDAIFSEALLLIEAECREGWI